MPGCRLVAVSAKKAVPPGKVEPKIAIRFLYYHRMVHAMHIGSDNEYPQYPVELPIHEDITVVEHRCCVQQYLEGQDRPGWRSKYDHHSRLDAHRKNNLDRMESRTSCDIDVEVGMVHSVETPEEWNFVKKKMLDVYREIEYHDHYYPSPPRGHYCIVEGAPASFLAEKCHSDS